MIEPKEIEVPTRNGPKTYILSRFPAVQGREIVTQYPMTAMPKVGDYATNEALMLKIMAHVAVPTEGGGQLQLTSRALVDNHVPDFEALMRLEWAMMEYNCSFLQGGGLSRLIEERALPFLSQSISRMLTDLLERSSGKASPPSTN